MMLMRFILLVVVGLAPAAALAVPMFSISPVALTSNELRNQALGLNDSGLIAGYDNLTGGFQRAIHSTSATSIDAGLPVYTTPMTSAEGHAIHDNRLLVGVGRYSAPAPGSTTGSVAYDLGMVFNTNTNQYLAIIEPFNDAGGRRTFAQAINDQNRVVGIWK